MQALPLVLLLAGATPDEYAAWQARLGPEHRVAFLDACHDGKSVRLAAVAVKDRHPGHARFGMDGEAYRKEGAEMTGKGYRLVSLCGYPDGKTTRFAAAWVKDDYRGLWHSTPQLSTGEYQQYFDEMHRKGMRPVHVVGYRVEGGYRLAAIFQAADERLFQGRHDLEPDRLAGVMADARKLDLRVADLACYPTPAGLRFTALFLGDGRSSVARRDLTPARLREEDRKLSADGYRLQSLCGYVDDGELCYAAVWLRTPAPLKGHPVTGKAVDRLRGFDEAMLRFMQDRGIPAGTLALSRDGEILLSRGYGWSDRDRKKPIAPDTPMRIASLAKPITAAAVLKLTADGKLDLDARAFALIGATPPAGKTPDPRLKDITVKHLLEHEGGWDRAATFDPMFRSVVIARELGKAPPADANDVIRYMAGQPLQFKPGSRDCYSNFGYCVLGRVIEKASGRGYVDHVRRDLLGPLGITSVELAILQRPGARQVRLRSRARHLGAAGRRRLPPGGDGRPRRPHLLGPGLREVPGCLLDRRQTAEEG